MAAQTPAEVKGPVTSIVLQRRFEVEVDEKLVYDAVNWIRERLAITVYKGATEIGQYVLEKFFSNDPARVHSRNPYKHASFRELSERCGTAALPISKTWLNSAVRAAVMCRLLPEGGEAFKKLAPSLQEALLPLRDPAKVEKVAQRASTKEWSLRDLRRAVAEERAKTVQEGERRGRPPTPVIVKTLNRSLKVFTLEGGKRSFTKAMVEELDEEQKKNALKAAQALAASLNKLIEKLEA